MKPQQRNFIVEVKSGRRRSAVRPASIWGDTDLKALVRPRAKRRISSQLSVKPSAPRQSAEGCDQIGGTVSGTLPVAGPAAVAEEAVVLPAHSEEASGSLVNAILPIKALQVPKRPRPTRFVRSPRSKKVATAVPVAVDELAALEEENRRLKGLLARRVRQENALLRKMLERFGAN
ncbi:hypothetical protein ASD02_23470 [Ensifer sp. Root1252]|nr:hypothetical protein ASD02_23470 [Ensifer sp. Root1252]KRC77995.1 hypothetical protein ASE32_28080 [Ensifer sp. Root231]KRD00416.1 hypothetical protein ASE47_24040 [Ensifer sp. Root258]